MSNSETSPCPAIQRWEDTHYSLLSALTSYVEACVGLKNSSLADLATDMRDLVPQIDRHITSLGSFVTHQISQTRSTLSAARNRLASPAYNLPAETLAEIFAHVIYDSIENEPQHQHQPMEQNLRSIYRRLYSLVGVCASWRNIVVQKRSFWAIIPMIDRCKCSKQPLEDVTERSLRRSGGTGLYIAASTSLHLAAVLRPIVSYGKHIRALNIQTGSRHAAKEVMTTLAVFSSAGIFSELSMRSESTGYFGNDRGQNREIIKQPSQHQERLKQFLGSLRALRIQGIYLDIYDVAFTNLVELRIEGIMLGQSPIFKRLLQTISSASNLQYLHLSSVSSYLRSEAESDTSNSSPIIIDDDKLLISLPRLKSVYIADMFFNDLETIFRSFEPCDEKWILSLGSRCIDKNDFGEDHETTVQHLASLLQGFHIDTLMLSERAGGNWLDRPQLSQLLKAVPNLTTLKMDSWAFNQEDWEVLMRPQDPEVGDAGFPKIHNLYISNARIFDELGMLAVVSSHNIQQLWLGGWLTTITGVPNMYSENAITSEDNIAIWLASNVPDFRLMDRHFDFPESETSGWRLW